ncbi:hypothetical protein B0A48_15851 [Cryoendolithus antarcticus]|uniref:BTB domain-containing protein n=1 Tax=Cryoendolithus antarcticus TaxID=1507870 RepID=A0A1V8SHG7_9PEZI|nr:hypothetical protein B0A48_15851 [Cryoendolithus antarcticus]
MTDRYEGLAAGVGSLLTSGKWTDFKVICHDRTFNVHKAVVCSQSAFFEAAVEGRFRESQENKIDLSEDDVEVVEVLINYPSYERPSTTKLEKNEVGKGKGKEKKPKTRTWDMHFHLKVYSIAQRCFVEGLQTLSATELRCLAETKWDTDEFREIVISIYNSTVGRDDLMREMVVRVLAEDAAHAVTRGRNAEQFTALVEIDGGLAAAHLSLANYCRNSLFINAQCSDLVVKCGSREWKVHKAIVLPQIEVVAKAFEGGFKEDTDNAYTFKDVDPAAVHAMLQFLYTGIYSADGNDVVSCHIHVIKLAEQYMLSLLCDLAAKKFEACMWRRWDQPDFAVAVDLIYAHGPDSMSRLKTTLLDIGRKHMAVLLREPETHPDFHEVVRRVPGFLADLCTGMSLFNNTIDLTAVVSRGHYRSKTHSMTPNAYLSDSEDSDSDVAVRDLLRGVNGAFASGKHADLTIEAGDRKWKVHMIIVCASCDYFQKACEGSFKEAKSDTIRLHDDLPGAVNAWLQFLYKCGFECPADFRGTLELCVSVYQLADKYLVKRLGVIAKKTIAGKMLDTNDADLAIAIDVLYGHSIEPVPAFQDILDALVRDNFLKLFGEPERYPEFRVAAAANPGFAAKAASNWASSRPKVSRFRCTCATCGPKHLVLEVGDGVEEHTVITCLSGMEATSNVIKLPDDDPTAVNALLEYLYGREFIRPADRTGADGFTQDTKLLVAVYRLADKYLMHSLKALAEKRFRITMEGANIDLGIPLMIDEVEDASSDELDSLHAMLINCVPAKFPKAFSIPDKFRMVHQALAKKPMLAYKITLEYATERTATVVRYKCDDKFCPSNMSKLCSSYGAGIDLPKDMYLHRIRCPWESCGGVLDQESLDDETSSAEE